MRNDPNLRSLNVWYRNWSRQIAHRIFYETKGAAVGTIVDPDNADAGLPDVVPVPIEADHIRICKPASKQDLIYVVTRDFLAKEVFKEPEGGTRYTGLVIPVPPSVKRPRPKLWGPIALRLAAFVILLVVIFKGLEALFFPPDPLKDATVHEIEEALRNKHPELTPEQFDRFIRSLREARGDPTFEKAVEEAKKGNTHVAEGIWRQIYEDGKKQQNKARKEQAVAARNLAATAIVESAADGLSWYREATTLDSQNMEGWLGLGDAAMLAGTMDEAESGFRQYISLAARRGDEREKATGHNRVGDVLVAKGNLLSAHKAYEDAFDIRRRLADAYPTNTEVQRDLSVSYERLGGMLVAKGDLPAARKAYEDALVITRRLVDVDPTNTELQRDLSVRYNKLGDVLVAEDNLPAARKAYEDDLAIARRLANAYPTDTRHQRDLWVSYNKLGDVLVAEDNLPAARKVYENALAIARRLVDDNATNSERQRDLSVSYNKLGDVLVAEDNLPAARKAHENALAIARRLVDDDPTNSERQHDLSVSYARLGRIHQQFRERDKALAAFQQGKAIMDKLTKLSPNNTTWRKDLVWFSEQIVELEK